MKSYYSFLLRLRELALRVWGVFAICVPGPVVDAVEAYVKRIDDVFRNKRGTGHLIGVVVSGALAILALSEIFDGVGIQKFVATLFWSGMVFFVCMGVYMSCAPITRKAGAKTPQWVHTACRAILVLFVLGATVPYRHYGSVLQNGAEAYEAKQKRKEGYRDYLEFRKMEEAEDAIRAKAASNKAKASAAANAPLPECPKVVFPVSPTTKAP